MKPCIKCSRPTLLSGTLCGDCYADSLRIMPELSGADRIAHERSRQQAPGEGRTLQGDMQYPPGTLAMAGLCYTLFAASSPTMRDALRPAVPFSGHWPWDEEYWKPGADNSYACRIRELEKAGALIAAEIDSLLERRRLGLPLSQDQS